MGADDHQYPDDIGRGCDLRLRRFSERLFFYIVPCMTRYTAEQISEFMKNSGFEDVEVFRKGNKAKFIRFEEGSVLNGGGGMEHMASFNYGYKIEAVRDWLFGQSK